MMPNEQLFFIYWTKDTTGGEDRGFATVGIDDETQARQFAKAKRDAGYTVTLAKGEVLQF